MTAKEHLKQYKIQSFDFSLETPIYLDKYGSEFTLTDVMEEYASIKTKELEDNIENKDDEIVILKSQLIVEKGKVEHFTRKLRNIEAKYNELLKQVQNKGKLTNID